MDILADVVERLATARYSVNTKYGPAFFTFYVFAPGNVEVGLLVNDGWVDYPTADRWSFDGCYDYNHTIRETAVLPTPEDAVAWAADVVRRDERLSAVFALANEWGDD